MQQILTAPFEMCGFYVDFRFTIKDDRMGGRGLGLLHFWWSTGGTDAIAYNMIQPILTGAS